MKRLYVTPKSVWSGQALGQDGKPLFHAPGTPMRHIDMFHPLDGSHYLDLDEGYILVALDAERSETVAETWHGHPEVARLPHPMWEGKVTLKDTVHNVEHRAKKFAQHHLDKLVAHPGLGITPQDTTLQVFAKAKAIHPYMGLAHLL